MNFSQTRCLLKTLLPSLILAFAFNAQALDFSFEQDSSLDLVHLQVAFRGGASQDPAGKNGLELLTTKLLTRGTKSKTKNQIDLLVDQLGSAIDVETRLEMTVIRASVLSKSLPDFLQLLSEIITQPSFPQEEIEKTKKEVTSNLLDQLSQDMALVSTRFEQYFFQGHPYSRSSQGRIGDLSKIKRDDLVKHHSELLSSDRILVLATGHATASQFQDFTQTLEKAARGKLAHLKPIPAFHRPSSKTKVVIFDKPDRTQTQVVVGQLGVSIQDPKVDALNLGNYVFGGGGFQSRLMQELRVKRGWTYGAASRFKLASKPHIWRMSFFPKNADTPPAIKESLQLAQNLKNNGISEDEFNFSKNSLTNSAGFSYNTPRKRMENTLIEKIYSLPKGYFEAYAQRISKLTRSEVNDALKDFIQPKQMLIGLVATASISKPAIAKELNIPESEIEVIDYKKEP